MRGLSLERDGKMHKGTPGLWRKPGLFPNIMAVYNSAIKANLMVEDFGAFARIMKIGEPGSRGWRERAKDDL
jgi:hypothetical protein